MKVSVLMITYNHEQFIAQALESILSQETDFDYEIVVGEDCSTDGTRDILLAYQERYPDRIRLLLPERNLGMIDNFMKTFEVCQGEFIAILEGDDYWTSPHKLQQQVWFLENNPGCSECFHNVEVVVQNHPDLNHLFFTQPMKAFYTLEDLAASNFIPTCSTLFRAKLFTNFPDWFNTMPMGDWPLHILNAEQGALGYLPETMAAYRVHGGGLWSRSSRVTILEKSLHAIEVINCHLNCHYQPTIERTIIVWEREMITLLLEELQYRQALTTAMRTLRNHPRRQCTFFLKVCIKVVVQSAKNILNSERRAR